MKRHIVPDIITGTQDLVLASPLWTLRLCAQVMTERRIGALMVVDGDQLVGIVSERDIVFRAVARDLDLDNTTVAAIMTPNPATIAPRDSAQTALALMQQRGFRHLPVVDDGRIVGIVSIRDLFSAVTDQLRDEVQQRDAMMFGGGYDMPG